MKSSVRFLMLIWILAIGGGLFSLVEYSKKEGQPADFIGPKWPEQSKLSPPNPHLARMIVFLHPRCPCSRASVTELERLLPSLRKSTKITAIFIRPEGRSVEWVQTSLWKLLSRNSDVEMRIDDGSETRIFGANTSGQTFLFDETGKLVFKGGITQARGHEGDSVGREAILSWSNRKNRSLASLPIPSDGIQTRVYGCSLHSKESEGFKR